MKKVAIIILFMFIAGFPVSVYASVSSMPPEYDDSKTMGQNALEMAVKVVVEKTVEAAIDGTVYAAKKTAEIEDPTIRASTGVAAGATAGAIAGSFVPIVGTAVGAVIGGTIGGIAAWWAGD